MIERAVHYANAKNPESEDSVEVWDFGKAGMEYSINGGPSQAVPKDMLLHPPSGVARLLLLEHIYACQTNDQEELTLP